MIICSFRYGMDILKTLLENNAREKRQFSYITRTNKTIGTCSP